MPRGLVGFRMVVPQSIVLSGLTLYLDAGKTASYPGTGTLWTDISGNGNNGTLTGGITYNSSNSGNLVFNGSSGYVTCGNNASLQITNNLTLSTWIKTSSLSVAQTIIGKQWCSGFQFGYTLSVLTNGTIQWYWLPNGNCSGGNPESYCITNNPVISANTWANIVIVHTSTSVNIYVNGLLIPYTLTGSYTALINSTHPFILGAYRNLSGVYSTFFNGSMSNSLVYNRALSATEITQNYNALKGRYI